MASNKQEIELVRSWRDNPEKFVREALKVELISSQQKQGLEEVRKLTQAKIKRSLGEKLTEEEEAYSRKMGVTIMSGHGTGKDAFASWIILWKLSCFPFPKIACTAPTGHQLKDVLWGEISKWLRQSIVKEWHTWQSDKIFFNEQKGKEWFAVARTANPRATAEEQAETIAGFHEDYLLYVIDEASGIPDPVFKPIEGALTGICNWVLMIYNPTRSKGFAIDSQFKNRNDWVCLRWNSEESELVTREQVERMEKKYGRDSNVFRIRVLGLPPKTDENILLPWDWVMDAVGREVEPLDTDPDVFGFDVGGGGDESVIYQRKGPKVWPAEQKNTDDSEELTGWALRRILDKMPEFAMIDAIGIGWGIAGNLRTRQTICNIVEVNVSESPSEDEKFFKLRDELWWRLRESFERREISIPDDAILIAELTTIKYEETNGKIKIESKKDLKKRGVESPNRADALCLTEYFKAETMRRMKVAKSNKKRREPAGLSWRTI